MIVTDGAPVVNDTDSITSGYSVPCARNAGRSPMRASMACVASSKASMNAAPMILRLASGSVTPARRVEEQVGGVVPDEVEADAVAERRLHLFELARAQQPVVDEHAVQPLADGLVDQDRGDGRIDAARQPEEHVRLADGGADRRHLLVDKGGGRPVAARAALDVGEIGEQAGAVLGVDDLRVELHADVRMPVAPERGNRALGAGGRAESVGQAREVVAVAHPDRRPGGDAVEERIADGTLSIVKQVRTSELAALGALDGAAEGRRHRLQAVADAEDGHLGAVGAAHLHQAVRKRGAPTS